MWLTACRHADRIVIEVTDDGPGLPPEMMPGRVCQNPDFGGSLIPQVPPQYAPPGIDPPSVVRQASSEKCLVLAGQQSIDLSMPVYWELWFAPPYQERQVRSARPGRSTCCGAGEAALTGRRYHDG